MGKVAAALVAIAAIAGCARLPVETTQPIEPTARVAHQLAPTGVLRVAVLTSNPIIGTKHPKTGAISGTTVTLARELAQRADVQARMMEFTSIPVLLAQASAGLWDVAVIAFDPERRSVVDFAPAHLAADDSSGLRFAFALPRKRPQAARFVAEFVEEMKRSGEVQRAIDAAGMQGAVRVAPNE